MKIWGLQIGVLMYDGSFSQVRKVSRFHITYLFLGNNFPVGFL